MKSGLLKASCLVAACAVLASCGGGGGGGAANSDAGAAGISAVPDVPSQVTFTPSAIQLVQAEGTVEGISERLVISPEPEGTAFFAVLAADRPVVKTAHVAITPNDDDSATLGFETDPSLTPGIYEGQVTLLLCRDVACKDEVKLAGNVLPYSIKVVPRVHLLASAEDVSRLMGPGSYMVDPGQTVVITSNTPVTWSIGSSIPGSANLLVTSSTPTRLEGTVQGRSRDDISVLAVSADKPSLAELVALNIR